MRLINSCLLMESGQAARGGPSPACTKKAAAWPCGPRVPRPSSQVGRVWVVA